MSLKAQIEAIVYAAETPITLEQMTTLVKESVLADGAADDAGSGGDVAHSGVGVLSQHIEGDVEDAIACLVHRARTGGLGGHDTIVAHQRAMK